MHVSGFDPDVIKSLIETRDEVLISVAVSELIGYDDGGAASTLLEPFLNDESADVRTKVMAFFISRFTREESEQLLNHYTSAGTYYYDIV